MNLLLTIIFTTFMSFSVIGATYIPLPIESQVQKSYGVVEGSFQGSTYKKLPNGSVATVASFHVVKHAGVKSSEIKNNFNFKVTLPGGVWDDLTYFVTGVPSFKKGEPVILLVSQGKYGIQLHNLAMGKYRVISHDNEKYLISDIFPKHPSLGKIPYEKFNAVVKKTFGRSLVPFTNDMYVYKKVIKSRGGTVDKVSRRGPASSSDEGEDSPFTPIFLVLVFAAIGAYGTYLVRDK